MILEEIFSSAELKSSRNNNLTNSPLSRDFFCNPSCNYQLATQRFSVNHQYEGAPRLQIQCRDKPTKGICEEQHDRPPRTQREYQKKQFANIRETFVCLGKVFPQKLSSPRHSLFPRHVFPPYG